MTDFRQFTSFCLAPSGAHPDGVDPHGIGVDWMVLVGCKTGATLFISGRPDPDFADIEGVDPAPNITELLEMLKMLPEVQQFIDEERGVVVTFKRLIPPIELERNQDG